MAEPKRVKLMRGNESSRLSVIPAQGEQISTIDELKLYLGDGNKAGGFMVNADNTIAVWPDQTDATKKLSLAWWIAYFNGSEATLRVPKGTHEILVDMTVPSNICLSFDKGAIIEVAETKTLTINGEIEAGFWQIFDGTGDVTSSTLIQNVYPEWFGAVAENATANDTAVAKALAFAEDKTLVFSQGIYQFDDQILVTVPVYIKMDNGTKLLSNFESTTVDRDEAAIHITANNVTLDHLILDCGGNDCIGIKVESVSNFNIRDSLVQNFGQKAGINLVSVVGGSILNTKVKSNIQIFTTSFAGIYCDLCDNLVIDGCYIEDVLCKGIGLRATTNSRISNCHIVGIIGYYIGYICKRITLSNCTYDGDDASATLGNQGLKVSRGASEVTVSGCCFNNKTTVSSNYLQGAINVIIDSCVFRVTSEEALKVENHPDNEEGIPYTKSVIISNCHFINTSTDANTYCVQEGPGVKNSIYSNNIFDGAGTGLLITSAGSTVTNNRCINQTITGIRIASSNVIVDSNTINYSGISTDITGIQVLKFANGTTSNIVISNNMLLLCKINITNGINCSVVNNLINNTSNAVTYNINITGEDIENISVIGNRTIGGGIGLFLYKLALNNAVVTGNVFSTPATRSALIGINTGIITSNIGDKGANVKSVSCGDSGNSIIANNVFDRVTTP